LIKFAESSHDYLIYKYEAYMRQNRSNTQAIVSNKHGIEAKRKQHIRKVSNEHENEAIIRIQKNEIASKD